MAVSTPMHIRLLPKEPFANLAYAWLIYLAAPLSYVPPLGHHPAAPTLAAIAAFLPLYFSGYWVRGRMALLPIAAIFLLGLLVEPINPGADVFFVYAGAFAHRVGSPRVAFSVLVGIVLAMVPAGLYARVDPQELAWTASITALIGAVVIYATDSGHKLNKAQREARELAVVAERERIGRDLHDLLGHTLSVIVLKSELASRLAPIDPQRSIVEIQDVERISRDALAEVRRAVRGDSAASFADELQRGRTALEAAGVTLASDVASVGLSATQEHELALALRETLTNVVRHARATRCTVQLTVVNDAIRLSVVDNGTGGVASEGAGLSGIRARVAALGGAVERTGADGTSITITVPKEADR